MKAQRGFGERNRLYFDSGDIGRLIDENLIPIDIQIRSDTNAGSSRRQLSGQVRHHCPRKSGRKTDIVAGTLPLSIRGLDLKKRNHRFDSRLVRGKT